MDHKRKKEAKEPPRGEDIFERARRSIELRKRESAEGVPPKKRKPPESGRVKINPAVYEDPDKAQKRKKKAKKPWITIEQGGLPSLGKKR